MHFNRNAADGRRSSIFHDQRQAFPVEVILGHVELAIHFDAPFYFGIIESRFMWNCRPHNGHEEEQGEIGIRSVEPIFGDELFQPRMRASSETFTALGAEQTVFKNMGATVAAEHQIHSLGLKNSIFRSSSDPG